MTFANSWSSNIPAVETKGGTGNAAYVVGDILYSDATNNLARRAIGTTGQLLTVVAGVPNWASAAAAGGSLTLLNSTTATSATSVTWGNTIITNAFSIFMIVWDSLTFSDNSNEFLARVSTDNGATFVTTNYQWASMNMGSESGTATLRTGIGGSPASWQIGGFVDNPGSNPAQMAGMMLLFTPTQATIATSMVALSNFSNDSLDPDNFGVSVTGGDQTVQASHNAFRFLPGSGTLSGNFHIYGLST
jgi:hypothetical protein